MHSSVMSVQHCIEGLQRCNACWAVYIMCSACAGTYTAYLACASMFDVQQAHALQLCKHVVLFSAVVTPGNQRILRSSYALLQSRMYLFCMQESEELHADPKVQKARFPSPCSSPWGLQDSDELPRTPTILKARILSPPSNPWGLQEVAPPLLEVSLPAWADQASVTYTPVQAFQASPTVSLSCVRWMPKRLHS